MKWILIGFLFILPSSMAEEDLKPVYTIEEDYTFFETDNLRNLYLVDGAELQKFSPAGSLMFRFSDKSLGDITQIDARYSLRPMLFYQNLNKLIILDNTLSAPQRAFDLEQQGLQFATLAAMSVNNNFWFYDAASFELIRTDEQFRVLKRTGNLGQLLGKDLNPNYLLERDNWVYLNDPKTGILVFDIYGTYYKTIPLKGLSRFNVRGQWISGSNESALLRYHRKNFSVDTIYQRQSGFRQALMEEDYIFVGLDNAVKAFQRLNIEGQPE